MGVNGLGCITCHKLNGHDALGIPGLDLATVPDRLRRAWFDQYLREPARFRPGTRMPSFWPDGEPTNREIGFGSGAARTRRQINSIWVYLSSLDQNPLPEGLADSDQFVLRPTEEGEPIVVRAFMKNVGMHAIAIGYPEEIHTAFDAQRMRFALAWRGRFLDAEGVWWKRRVEMLEPLGEDVIALSSGAPFARLPDSKASWPEAEDHRSDYRFDGYRLDQNGVPTFLYRYQDIQIADRLVPNASSDGFRRIIELSDTEASGEARKTLWFRAAAGDSVRRASDRRWVVDDRRTIHWTAPGEAHLRILDENGRAELRVPVEFDGKGTARIEMELTW
jgi:hypothetical protein